MTDKEKSLGDFHFREESTPTTDVRDFVYAVMQRVEEIRDDLDTTITDYITRDDEDQMRFGLSAARAVRDMDWLLRVLELIHNMCWRDAKKGGAK